MAAVLKKRVVAEFTQVVQEKVKCPPVKKLRLTYRPPHAELRLDLSVCQSPRDSFQVLLNLEERLPLGPEQIQSTVAILVERIRVEKEAAVRAKIAGILGQLGRAPACNALNLSEDIQNLLGTEKSSIVVAALLGAQLLIGQTCSGNIELRKSILELSCKLITSSSHLVRSRCLSLIGELGSPDLNVIELGNSVSSALSILSSFSHDSDCRVRTQAFQSMLLWHQRGLRIEQSVYAQACAALTDDHEGVRLAAVKLIWVLSQLYPDHIIKLPESGESIRLVDDGFAKICNVVNDLSIRVRAEAAGLLGSLHSVSPHFLSQTLDKKLMSNMRFKANAHDRQRDHFESGEFSTGQKWADDAPKDKVDPESVSLISGGACGAFVHGLEDEYLEVRNASIDSLCELASHSPSFAKACQDFLVDMFNDEIEGVRLNAIHSLRKICHHFLLREDQLEIILSVLKDFNGESREAIRDMLSYCRLGTKACLRVLIFTLLDNLKRYPEDKTSIWKCMKDLGRHHPSLVLAMVPDLLCVHPYFESIEPDVDDPAYVSVLALVLNAAVDSATMPALFPSHILLHYTYLRDSLPDLIPELQLHSTSVTSAAVRLHDPSATVTATFLHQTLARLNGLQLLDHRSAIQLMLIAIRDLEQVKEIEPDLSATAECVALFLQCQLNIDKALCNGANGGSVVFNSHQEQSLQKALVDKTLALLRRIEHQFLGLGVSELVQIRQLCLRARTLQLLGVLQDTTIDKNLACNQYQQSVALLQDLLTCSGSKADLCTLSLLAEMTLLSPSGDPSLYHRALGSSLRQHSPSVLRLGNQLQKAQVVIVEPSGSSDVTLKFSAGLAVAVPFIAQLSNIRDISRIRIRVIYPDQQTQLIVPSTGGFKQLSNLQYRLVTRVLLSHSVWSEPGCVDLSLVLMCPDDTDDITGVSSNVSVKNDRLIEISPSVSVFIAPVPARKI